MNTLLPPPLSPSTAISEEKSKKSSNPLGWHLDRYEREMLLAPGGAVIPRKNTADLLQNCDLPPPLRFLPPEKNDTIPTITARSPPPPPPLRIGGGDQYLLRALQLSQTRAREAERKASAMGERNEQMGAMLLEESLRLFAHRQLVKLLQIDNSRQQMLLEEEKRSFCSGDDDDDGVGPTARRCMVIALCLGITGLGLVLGYRYLF